MNKEPRYSLDREKLKTVVHYICDRCDVRELGNVKLHKILYFSDMLKFLSSGTPLTGVEYQKQQFGPIARHLAAVLSELIKEKKVKVEKRDYFGFNKIDYISLISPNTRTLSNEDVQIINDVIAFVCNRSAKEISEFSHNAAWEAADFGEIIPYYSAYGLIPSEVSDADVQFAAREAVRIRPLLDA